MASFTPSHKLAISRQRDSRPEGMKPDGFFDTFDKWARLLWTSRTLSTRTWAFGKACGASLGTAVPPAKPDKVQPAPAQLPSTF